jgi:hypothetical protein
MQNTPARGLGEVIGARAFTGSTVIGSRGRTLNISGFSSRKALSRKDGRRLTATATRASTAPTSATPKTMMCIMASMPSPVRRASTATPAAL